MWRLSRQRSPSSSTDLEHPSADGTDSLSLHPTTTQAEEPMLERNFNVLFAAFAVDKPGHLRASLVPLRLYIRVAISLLHGRSHIPLRLPISARMAADYHPSLGRRHPGLTMTQADDLPGGTQQIACRGHGLAHSLLWSAELW
jgi:hypothetical protein